jgi:predicted lipoprotein with Yx(FWY)xxD motif
MRSSIKFLLPTLLSAALLSACGSSSSGNSSSSNEPASSSSGGVATVQSATNSGLGGNVLVNDKGLTLYSLSAERAGRFICTSSCTQIWHPLTVAAGSKPSGNVTSLGVIKRPDGADQVTYKGMPLYTFAQDMPGQLNGQGVKDVGVWRAVQTSGSSSATTTSSSSSPSSSASAGGAGKYTY